MGKLRLSKTLHCPREELETLQLSALLCVMSSLSGEVTWHSEQWFSDLGLHERGTENVSQCESRAAEANSGVGTQPWAIMAGLVTLREPLI